MIIRRVLTFITSKRVFVPALRLACAIAVCALAASSAASARLGDSSDVTRLLAPTLAQVQSFARAGGEELWPGYGNAPFGFLLIAGHREVLLCQPGPTPGFSDGNRDTATGCVERTRARSSLQSDLLAAMSVVGSAPTIVMGTPAATRTNRGAWIRSILHEHFHQLQFAAPNYYARAGALGLAGDDAMMWPLVYRFPYAAPAVGNAYALASHTLAAALDARGTRRFIAAFDAYLNARVAFSASVSARDWRYFDFEMWQEGVARWTETRLGLAFPDDDVREAARDLERGTMAQLRSPNLAAMRRTAVYPLGAGEAMLTEACGDDWRKTYLENAALTPLLEAARKECTS